ncbi:hypothetical protein AHAS_Ahas09G0061800 [Arachis hypogaea]
MNTSTCYIWTEYHEMGVEGIRAVSDYKAYTAHAVLDLLRFVVPTMMKSGDALPHTTDMEIYSNGGDEDPSLKDGVYVLIGFPVLSAGFMCAKGWRKKVRFNPSGIRTFIREYKHAAPANLLGGSGTQSGDHVDIFGNITLIEDIIRVAEGASSEDLGRDRVHLEIFKGSENINSHCNKCFGWPSFVKLFFTFWIINTHCYLSLA